MVKRYFTAVVVFVLVATPLVSLTGCGSNTDKAKEYMQTGDVIIGEIESQAAQVENIGTEMGKMIDAIFTDQIPSSKEMKKKADEYNELSASILKESQEAKKEYEKILDLDGVPNYSKYAKLAIEFIGTMEKLYGKFGETIDYVVKTLEQYESGTTIDPAEFSANLQNSFAEVEQIGNSAEEMTGELKQLKKDKKL